MNDSITVPRYTVTPKIADALAGIERRRRAIEGLSISDQEEAWLGEDVANRRAAGTVTKECISI